MTEVRTASSTGGEKGVKPERFSLIPKAPLDLLGKIYDFGTRKYMAHNYRKGYEWSKSYDALQRHLTSWWERDELDDESGLSHLGHAAWHIFALIVFSSEERYKQFDDRYDGYLAKDEGLSAQELYESGVISREQMLLELGDEISVARCVWEPMKDIPYGTWVCAVHSRPGHSFFKPTHHCSQIPDERAEGHLKGVLFANPRISDEARRLVSGEGVTLLPEDERPFIHPDGKRVECEYAFIPGPNHSAAMGYYFCKIHESKTNRHPSEGANRPCNYISPPVEVVNEH